MLLIWTLDYSLIKFALIRFAHMQLNNLNVSKVNIVLLAKKLTFSIQFHKNWHFGFCNLFSIILFCAVATTLYAIFKYMIFKYFALNIKLVTFGKYQLILLFLTTKTKICHAYFIFFETLWGIRAYVLIFFPYIRQALTRISV